MKGFLKSFSPLLKKIKKVRRYFLEIILLFISLFLAIASLSLYSKEVKNAGKNNGMNIIKANSISLNNKYVYVDIAGAVKSPDLYKAPEGTRLKSIIEMAGGLTEEADKQYFRRNLNLARIIQDQDKVYIPTIQEVRTGDFINNAYKAILPNDNDIKEKIDINHGTLEELDTLPGIGQVTAEKIVSNRPYKALQDLIDKKVISENVWENIKELITI